MAFGQLGPSPQIQVGDVRLDAATRKLFERDQNLTLTQYGYNLLYTLMTPTGYGVSRAELMGQVWGVNWQGDTHTLNVHIRWVREKIEENPAQRRHIQTERGVGYRFAVPEELN